MPLTTQSRWPVALAALEPHEKARDFIHEYAEIREWLAHARPGELDAEDRRWRYALERWFFLYGADAEAAELDEDHDVLLKLAGSLRKVLDGLEASHEKEVQS